MMVSRGSSRLVYARTISVWPSLVELKPASVKCGSDAAPRTGLQRGIDLGRCARLPSASPDSVLLGSSRVCSPIARKIGASSMGCLRRQARATCARSSWSYEAFSIRHFCATEPLPASNCDRHPELSWFFFYDRNEGTRSIFMSAELHRLIASPMHAERCAAVGLNSANAAVGTALMRNTSAPNTPMRSLVITVSPLAFGA